MESFKYQIPNHKYQINHNDQNPKIDVAESLCGMRSCESVVLVIGN